MSEPQRWGLDRDNKWVTMTDGPYVRYPDALAWVEAEREKARAEGADTIRQACSDHYKAFDDLLEAAHDKGRADERAAIRERVEAVLSVSPTATQQDFLTVLAAIDEEATPLAVDEAWDDIHSLPDADYSAKYGMCGGCGNDNEECCGGCKESLCRRCPERIAAGQVAATGEGE